MNRQGNDYFKETPLNKTHVLAPLGVFAIAAAGVTGLLLLGDQPSADPSRPAGVSVQDSQTTAPSTTVPAPISDAPASTSDAPAPTAPTETPAEQPTQGGSPDQGTGYDPAAPVTTEFVPPPIEAGPPPDCPPEWLDANGVCALHPNG